MEIICNEQLQRQCIITYFLTQKTFFFLLRTINPSTTNAVFNAYKTIPEKSVATSMKGIHHFNSYYHIKVMKEILRIEA